MALSDWLGADGDDVILPYCVVILLLSHLLLLPIQFRVTTV